MFSLSFVVFQWRIHSSTSVRLDMLFLYFWAQRFCFLSLKRRQCLSYIISLFMLTLVVWSFIALTPAFCLLIPARIKGKKTKQNTVAQKWALCLAEWATHHAHVLVHQIVWEDTDSPMAGKVTLHKTPSAVLKFYAQLWFCVGFFCCFFFFLFWLIKGHMETSVVWVHLSAQGDERLGYIRP